MNGERPREEIHTLAALYALGVLDEQGRRAFEAHLNEGCPPCAADVGAFGAVIGELAFSSPPATPPPILRERVLSIGREQPSGTSAEGQVWKTWTPTPDIPRWVVRSSEGEWQPTAFAGVLAKNLFVDKKNQSVTMLVRMLPGSYYPAHRHADTEQCYVVQGDLIIGHQTFGAGDYLCESAGSIDEVIRTAGGCLLFIISSQHDELLL